VNGSTSSSLSGASLLLNCQPYSYLRHVLTEMPQRPSDADITDLLPFNHHPQAASAID
jgi:transposase